MRRGEVGATAQHFEVTLEDLRQLRQRIDRHALLPDDWPLLAALVSKQIARAEQRQERRIAKIAAAAVAGQDTREGLAASDSSPADESTGSVPSSADATRSGEPKPPSGDDGGGEAHQGDSNERKGHGRNGASAYRKAQHFFHALAPGVIGALCATCRLAKTYGYREKILICIFGQPLFGAEVHHHEQARCRNCGHIVRAQAPAYVPQGLGSDYVR
jgi:hypothetical protein